MSFQIDNFKTLYNSKEGIEKLKSHILDLAIRGMLVEQDEEDEPVGELLKRIKVEKKKLIKEKKIRKQKSLPPITEEEKPFKAPKGWEWVRLGEVVVVVGGGTPKTTIKDYWDNGNIPWVTPADLNGLEGKYISHGRRFITDLGLQKSSAQLMPAGTVLFSSRAPIGYTAIAKNKISTNQGFKSCVPIEIKMSEYIYYYLTYSAKTIDENASGTTFKEVSGTIISNLLFPLPPLVEQQRIVEKIDKLFALCNKLEEEIDSRDITINKLPTSLVDMVEDSADGEELKNNLLYTIDNFKTIFQTVESMDELRNLVLQLAIQGKLVPQNAQDESAEKLLEKIRKEKEKLIKENKIRKTKPLPPITEEEKPFELPKGWKWVRLGDISLINMGQSPKGNTVNDKEGLEFHQGKTFFGDRVLKKSNRYTTDAKKIAKTNDILLSVRAPVGDLNITDREICIGRGLCAISGIGNISKEFYFYFILALREYLIQKSTGTTFSAITASVVNEMILPLPPLAEQKRIVDKVDAIMAIIDNTEEEIRKKNEIMEKLLAENAI